MLSSWLYRSARRGPVGEDGAAAAAAHAAVVSWSTRACHARRRRRRQRVVGDNGAPAVYGFVVITSCTARAACHARRRRSRRCVVRDDGAAAAVHVSVIASPGTRPLRTRSGRWGETTGALGAGCRATR